MIKRLTLLDFMAHVRTVFDLSPGLNVLTGPNNTGKSAVVEALRCLAQNPPPRHFIRHGAAEARVSVEMDDGTVVAWVRRPKYALYELTRPGAAEPEVFAKFGRTPPEEVMAVLGIGPVVLESGEEVDVHIGNQREPVFLLNQPGSVLAGFFAAATEAAHLIAMQNLLTERARKAKIEQGRLSKRLLAIAAELDRLAPLPALEMRLGMVADLETALAAGDREAAGLAALLAARDRLRGRIAGQLRTEAILTPLAEPPRLVPTARLAETVALFETLAARLGRASRRQGGLSPLASPPGLYDTASLSRQTDALIRARATLDRTARKAKALASLAVPPVAADVAGLATLAQRLADCRARAAGLAHKDRALSRLALPPVPADTRPLAETLAALTASRAALTVARAALARNEQVLSALTGRIEARLAELGACPLCGGALSTDDFLGPGHNHNNSTTPTP